jgi:hypothetical protein
MAHTGWSHNDGKAQKGIPSGPKKADKIDHNKNKSTQISYTTKQIMINTVFFKVLINQYDYPPVTKPETS